MKVIIISGAVSQPFAARLPACVCAIRHVNHSSVRPCEIVLTAEPMIILMGNSTSFKFACECSGMHMYSRGDVSLIGYPTDSCSGLQKMRSNFNPWEVRWCAPIFEEHFCYGYPKIVYIFHNFHSKHEELPSETIQFQGMNSPEPKTNVTSNAQLR